MSVENAEVTNNSNSHEQKMVNGDQHVNGMSNGHSDKHKSSSHKSSSKDKHRDKERSKDHKSSKSSHRDKDRDTEKHSSSNGKSKHSSSSTHKSSHKSKDRDKDKDREKDKEKEKEKEKEKVPSTKEHKSSSNHDGKDREKSDKHKSSNSSSKDKHSSSSGSKHKSRDKDRDREKDKDRHRSDHHKSSSSGSKHKSKDKDRERSDKHKSSSSSHKDKSSSSRHHDSVDGKPNVAGIDIKEEAKSPIKDISNNHNNHNNHERLVDMSQNSSCDYSLSQFKDEECSLPVKSENESEEPNFVDVKGEPDDEYENEAPDSEEDIPLSKRKKVDTDSEDEAPLKTRKKAKTENKDKKKKRVKEESDNDEEDDESDYGKSKKKKAKKEPVSTPAKKPAPRSVKMAAASPVKGGRKKKKEEEEPEVWKWWEEEKRNDGTKWSFLEHKGPMFAPPYEPLPDKVKFEYDGKRLKLSEEAEEIAGFYARLLDHEYTSKVAFNTNFFKDWRKSMSKKEREVINDLHKCNFKYMQTFFLEQTEKNRNRTKEEKLALKEKNEAILKEYGIAIIDGHKEKIGNFKIEPPGLFRGRGEHPKMGTLKRRIVPEDIIINCSKDSKAPQPPKGHRWKEVRHDNTVTWLASWTENVQNQVKYIMLNPSSKIKGEKDYMKYETARHLKNKISKIRDTYTAEWKSKEMRIRQRAVALYFIDKLALRAGNEKDEDQADTVGCCSLRYEHVTLHEEMNDKENVVVFDFLGKDSIRYYNEVSVEKRVFKNLQLFKENKKEGDDLFDRLNTSMLNEHLKELMDGLTAKVFRTYNASFTLQNQLDELTEDNMTIPEKLLAYNRANRAVAILCNHQRAVPKTHGKSMENLREKIRAKREQIDDVQRELKDIKRGSAKGSIDKEKKKKQLERLKEQLQKLEIQETDKDENKTIALGTSKLNYLDPRISVAWCKKFDVPVEKIFNKTQRDKFRWAIEMVDEDYVF